MKKLSSNQEVIINYCREHLISIPKFYHYIQPYLPKITNLENYLEELDVSKFETIKPILKLQQELLDTLHHHEFKGSVKDRLMIEEIETHSLLEFPITCQEMSETNKAIAEYCENKGELDYSDFIKYLLKSKTIRKCSPPMPYIEKICEETANELYGEN